SQGIAGRKFSVRSPARPKARPKGPLPRSPGTTKQLTVTVSIGVAERGEHHSTAEAVMKAADKALYRSKKAGRNRVTAAR
ncbi:MAG: diguanylate cyclase, partial [Holophagales bacterium]|nr:diguanylate cyclase [Holophagales bacterium]